MNNWKKEKFGDVVNFPPIHKISKGQICSHIELRNVNIGLRYVKSLDKKEYKGSGSKFTNGDILFARITPSLQNGKIAQVKNLDGIGFGSGEFFVFNGKKNITDNDYVYYLSKTESFRKNAIKSMVGASGRQRANNKFVANTLINLPPLSIQKKISKILSSYDNLIHNSLERILLLNKLLQYLYEDWFLTKQIDGKLIPSKEIEINKLSEFIEFSMNGGWGNEELLNDFSQKAYVVRGTDIPDVSRGMFSDTPLRFHKYSNYESRKLVNGDIILEISNGNVNNVGRSLFVDDSLINVFSYECICASFCKMIRPKNSKHSFFLDQHIKYIYRTNKMYVYKSQGANGINNFRFNDMIQDEIIFIPNEKSGNSLFNKFEKIYNQISNLKYQIKLLAEARDILLPRLIDGKINLEINI